MPAAVRAYVRSPRLVDPIGEIRAQWHERETSFLDTLARTVFAVPANPYCRMFQLAGCELGDLTVAVKRDGLERTLEALHRAGVYLTHDEFTARRAGGALPRPDALPPNDFRPVAEWIARRRAESAACAVTSMVSSGVRVAAAALDHGFDIRGTFFSGGGEAVTSAKRAVVESAGAEMYARHHITEIGNIGHACRQMPEPNSVHVYTEAVAVISHRRPAALSDTEVSSLLFTTLLPHAPRVLVNVEMDDSGVIAESRCDCAFTRAGLSTVVHDVASFGKLTGHGVTLVGTDVVAILEERLPAALGGRVGDFQLVERDDGRQTQIILRVSPRVPSSPEAVRRCFLDELRRGWGGAYAAGSWMRAGAIDVVVAEPLTGRTGKILRCTCSDRRARASPGDGGSDQPLTAPAVSPAT